MPSLKLAVCAVLLILATQSAHVGARTEAVQQYTNLAYGKQPLQNLDVYYPASASRTADFPVIIFVHGGGWQIGDKGTEGHGAKGRAFAQNGCVFISVNYRLVPDVMHPEQVMDVAQAIKFVGDNAHRWGGNPNRIFLMGHSAGAHLVDLVATNLRFLQQAKVDPRKIRGVISLDTASLDLVSTMRESSARRRSADSRITAAFGVGTATWEDASPTLSIRANNYLPPFLMVYGAARRDASAQTEQFAHRLRSAGGSCEIFPVPLSHRDISLSAGDSGSQLFEKILQFVEQH